MSIPVIDLFAGPGGLGEGFSSIFQSDGNRVFDIKLSIEKDHNAHETLRLRSFTRKFPKGKLPDLYYDITRQQTWDERKKLINQLAEKYPEEWAAAEAEAWCFELPYPEEFDKNGKKKGGYTASEIQNLNQQVDDRIKNVLKGEEDFLLIGGPPCQAYSLVGRSRNQGIHKEDHRVELYKAYLRIIAFHRPAVFVMENVKGLLSSEVDGLKVFDLMKSDLENPASVFPDSQSPNYKIYSLSTQPEAIDEEGKPVYSSNRDFLIKSEDYGVPQKRHRVILLGIREDLKHTGEILKPKTEQTTLREVIGALPKIRSGLSRTFERSQNVDPYGGGKKKRIYRQVKDSDENWLRQIGSQIAKLESWGDISLNGLNESKLSALNGVGAEFIPQKQNVKPGVLSEWYQDVKLGGVINHQSRAHLTQDLVRYMFASLFLKENGRFPKLDDYARHHEELIPDHANVASGKFTDRFRVQLPDQPATTVTSHISKDGHYFIHYDEKQCRSFTVREAARVQTFPDNYLFCGARTAQFHQVGNAVPPYLAMQIGKIVSNVFDKWK